MQWGLCDVVYFYYVFLNSQGNRAMGVLAYTYTTLALVHDNIDIIFRWMRGLNGHMQSTGPL